MMTNEIAIRDAIFDLWQNRYILVKDALLDQNTKVSVEMILECMQSRIDASPEDMRPSFSISAWKDKQIYELMRDLFL